MLSNPFIQRTKTFAVDTIKLTEMLPSTYLGKHIKHQLIRSSTSVAANYRACRLAQSKAAFIAKLSIVIEEIDESFFWLDLSLEFNLLDSQNLNKTIKEAKELTAIFVSTRKTMQQKNKH